MSKRMAANKNVILKDLSQLRPVNERIEMLSGILHSVFKGESDEYFRPLKGTQAYRMWSMKKLDMRQQIAWQEYMDDVRLERGRSGNTTASYGDFTDGSDSGEFRVPVAYENSHRRRLNALFRHLDRHETSLLVELTQDTLRGNSSFTIEFVGMVRSGFNDKASCRTAGVVHIQRLLDKIADVYNGVLINR